MLDGSDNFPTRYLVSDAAVRTRTPPGSSAGGGTSVTAGSPVLFHPWEVS